MSDIELIRITPQNVDRYGIGCIRDKKHPGYKAKVKWFKNQYEKGLVIIIAQKEGKYAGFIEYTAGEHAWRPVQADGYLFIHCIWVYPTKNMNTGLGSTLIDECLKDAEASECNGVAVVSSSGSWMAKSDVFLKSGFEVVSEKARFELLVNKIKDAPPPSFLDWEERAQEQIGLELIYSHQCPANAKSIHDIEIAAAQAGVELQFTEIKEDFDSQSAPTGFGVFQLLYNGRVLADHYISGTRFKNILKNEKLV